MAANFSLEKTIEEINSAYNAFIHAYLQKRDLHGLCLFFAKDITNIGSGLDELNLDLDSVKEIFQRDIIQCPAPLSYDEKFRKIIPYSANSGLIINVFNSSTLIDGTPVSFKGYRHSLLWEKNNGEWRIRHIHFSKGEPELKEGESFPLNEIAERNRELANLVAERTRELVETNTKLSDANKEISEVKQRFESIFEKVSDGIIVADWKEKNFFLANQRICQILGYRKKELEELWLSDLIPEQEIQTALGKILQECNGDRLIAEEIPLLTKSKQVKYFDVSSQTIKFKKRSYMVSLYRDITELKASLQQKRDAEVAQKASEAKNLFLSNMSHEIRTPITGIMGMTEILAKTKLNKIQSEYLQTISESSRILLNLINDIFDITSIESGNLELRQEPVNICKLISNIVKLIQPELLSKHNNIFVDISPDVPATLNTDKLRLEQVIMNFVNNAIKFTNKGTITIKAEMVLEGTLHTIRFSIIDTGQGIKEEDQAKLFRKFQQLDNSLSRQADGSGVGLYLCRKLVTQMGGDVGMESKPGKGSIFWFSLPVKDYKPEQCGEEETSVSKEISTTPLNLKVLLVDDKEINLKIISLMLKSAQCEVEMARNGLEAIETFDPQKHQVVLMDIMMPKMDGITAMKELRKKYDYLPPVIAVTANAMLGDEDKYAKVGFDGYIAKPLTLSKLVSELAKLKMLDN